ncbi:NdvB [Clostridium botulinum]|uniref:GH36-type glycosyl hydrolase domain-containing protein n=1 Tax=Clostridium botulinum TaxID=1491 RepID=UPI0006A74E68|nr:glucoamylase family protein [Clostridium botulinum]KOM96135.1 NdvB [Clostridium botulinum]KON01845.1 NdvB [Clostridium botulinum]MBY7005183.1 cyclic beta 1-2 glucan synthetase [Clostridium botulinum]MCR1147783.1 cyclic beta 1-2 glucan synthetase [Clostridium botulinum]NFH94956.1 cyclic beta 1-2 glucan synthetase [Clostridium botulinum]
MTVFIPICVSLIILIVLIYLIYLIYKNNDNKESLIDDINNIFLGEDKQDLEQFAEDISEFHSIVSNRKCRKLVLESLDKSYERIMNNYKYIVSLDEDINMTVPAGEWLLDNIYLIEKQYKDIKKNMPSSHYVKLPVINKGIMKCYPRVYHLALAIIHNFRGNMDKDFIITFMSEYQKNNVLTSSEVWALPIMLRIALIQKISIITEEITYIQRERKRGEELADKIIKDYNNRDLEKTIDELKDKGINISPYFIETFINIINDNGIKDEKLNLFIQEQLEVKEKNINNIINLGYRKQSKQQIVMGNCINGLRHIEAINWKNVFSNVSVIEEILKEDPLKVYNDMDFPSKDFYRNKIERLSRKLKLPESFIAKKSIECAQQFEVKTEEDNYKKHVGYYIVEEKGARLLKKVLGVKSEGKDKIKDFLIKNKVRSYVTSIIVFTALFEFLIIKSIGYKNVYIMLLQFIVFLIPSSEIIVSILNWSLNNLTKPDFIPKLQFGNGITEESSTVVVIPTLIGSKKRAKELVKEMEVYYLANKEDNIYFAVLGDFKDSKSEKEKNDEEIIKEMLCEVKELNNKYCKEGEEIFFFLNRYRQYNEKEKIWMGWERKRGKLEEFNKLIRGEKNTSYNIISGDINILKKVKYVITLDADTKLPRDVAKRLIGAMEHPLNKPIINSVKKSVIHGYGLMQPRVSIGVEDANKTLFSKIFSGQVGLDTYTTAVSDIYQDLFKEGIFTGKGIYHVDTFNTMLNGEIKENSVLSHDLLEGSYVRTALVTDIELVDGYPAYYNSSCKRLHRWVRGDWQLIPWIFKRTSINRLSKWKIVDNLRRSLLAPSVVMLILISLFSYYGTNEMITVAFLSVIAPILFNISEVIIFPSKGIGLSGRIYSVKNVLKQFFLIFAFIPHRAYLMIDAIIRTLYRLLISKKNLLEWQTAEEAEKTSRKDLKGYIKSMWVGSLIALLILYLSIRKSNELAILLVPACIIWFISPYIAFYVSRDMKDKLYLNKDNRRLLVNIARRTWAYFEDFVCEDTNWLAPDNYQEEPYKGIAYRTSPTNIGMGITSNIVAYDLGFITLKNVINRLENILFSMNKLDKYEGHFYNWYDIKTGKPLNPRYISAVDSGNLVGYLWLTEESLKDIINKPLLSKKNIDGLLSLLELANEELKKEEDIDNFYFNIMFILKEMEPDIVFINNIFIKILNKQKELENFNVDINKFYWNKKLYDFLNESLQEFKKLIPWKDQIIENIGICKDVIEEIREFVTKVPIQKMPNKINCIIKNLEQIKTDDNYEREWLLNFIKNLNISSQNIKNLIQNIHELNFKLDELAKNTDFKILYNEDRKLFTIGYNIDSGEYGNSYYDLLASEARQASFVAIAKGDIPQDNWITLGRAITYMGKKLKGLASWSGTMFEYFMPLLIMKNYEGTLLDQTYKSVIKGQQLYAKDKKIPWGISESAFYHFDGDKNYQYMAFGVPGIGIKRGLSKDLVISPYSTVLALQKDVIGSIENINRLIDCELLDKYGFYEAVDYTKNRIPKGKSKAIIKSFMVHHQGMSLMALNNTLNNNILQNRFHNKPEVKATELLLQERENNRIIYDRSIKKYNTELKLHDIDQYSRIYNTAKTDIPRVGVLSNGSYSLMLSNRGGGYSKKDDITIYRWREDLTSDSKGLFFYIKNINANNYWSATYEPCKSEGEHYKVKFYSDKIIFAREDGNITTETHVTVSQEEDAEIRSINLKNNSNHDRVIEVTSYCEATLANYNTDLVHPSFSNLFVKTELREDPFCLLANRRKRSEKDISPWLMQTVAVEGDQIGWFQYETSRIDFIGRGRNLYNPQAMDNETNLKGSIGPVLDPIISIRTRVRLKAKENCTVAYTTAFCNSKEEGVKIAEKYRNIDNVKNAFNLSWSHSNLEMKHLGIRSTAANMYQYILSNILFINRNIKEREKYIKYIKLSQSNLWAYGISGDYPIVLVTLDKESGIDIVRQLLLTYKYWRMKNINVDLIIVNTKESSYMKPIEDSILNLVNSLGLMNNINKSAGVFLFNKPTMKEDDLDLLKAICRLYIDCNKGSIAEQIDTGNNKSKELNLLEKKEMKHIVNPYKFKVPKLEYFNDIGGFDIENNEYTIVLKDYNNTPLPWINVMSNGNFGFHVSESGSSYSWYKNSRENKLTNWCNDPVVDGESEHIYIRDEVTGEIWSITPKPIRDEGQYIINHGFGYSNFKHYREGVIGEITSYCPIGDNCKISLIKLKNNTDIKREISVTYYASTVLGVSKQLSSPYISTYLDKDNFIYSRNPYNSSFKETTAYLKIVGGKEESFTGNRKEFLGIDGTIEKPKALNYEKLGNEVGAGIDPCMAENSKITLEPNEEKVLIAILGAEDSIEAVKENINKYDNEIIAFKELNNTKNYWKKVTETIKVKTPDKSMDLMLNGWLLYQVIVCRLWARTAFYQSGGAYGFRDQLQDVMSICYIDPDITKKQIIYSSSRQFREGDVQHWWHPVVESGIRTRFSDDLLWLPYVTIDYIKNTGDYSILEESSNYLEEPLLREGEDERYNVASVSSEKGTIYEHCIRAINRALKFGEHNIPLMGSGDWNDGMSTVGNQGRGESVWLGWFLYTILESFINICDYKKDTVNMKRYEEYLQFIKENIEENAWDGSWYRRAYFDDGTPLGSIENEECTIDSLSQSWSVLSGAGKESRVKEAMAAVERNLIKKDKGIIALLTPAFDKSTLQPGYIKGYLPGVRENGGQYTHAAIWVVLAFSKLKMEDKAWSLFNMINPINHTKSYFNCQNYKVEPYVMTADIYDVEPHIGRGGWSWYTGAASWMYKTGIKGILGLKLKGKDGFYVDPCIPKDWSEYEIIYNRGNCRYNIKVIRENKKELWIDGELKEGNIIPIFEEGTHEIKVII